MSYTVLDLAALRWERLRDHGHGRRPSPTQTAPRGGRSRDYLAGGGRSASHVPYPALAGRHRGQAAIGATGVTGAALNSLFYRSRVQLRAVTAEASCMAASSARIAMRAMRACAARIIGRAACCIRSRPYSGLAS